MIQSRCKGGKKKDFKEMNGKNSRNGKKNAKKAKYYYYITYNNDTYIRKCYCERNILKR